MGRTTQSKNFPDLCGVSLLKSFYGVSLLLFSTCTLKGDSFIFGLLLQKWVCGVPLAELFIVSGLLLFRF